MIGHKMINNYGTFSASASKFKHSTVSPNISGLRQSFILKPTNGHVQWQAQIFGVCVMPSVRLAKSIQDQEKPEVEQHNRVLKPTVHK